MADRAWRWAPVGLGPLGLTLLFGALVAEGHLNLGGGCKDLFAVIPFLAWSLVFLPSYLFLWWRGRTLLRAVGWAAALSTAVVVAAWAVLLVVVSLKLA